MAKKVLIVESSLAVRGIAESLLRQNGIEVFGADKMEFARDIINSTKVDLILVATEITDSQGRKFYDLLSTESDTSSIPLMLLHDPSNEDVSDFPPEMIINKPFTPRNFLSAVSAFVGVGDIEETSGEESPFGGGGDIEDDIIDAALGLDKLEVHGSEVLNDDSGVIRLDKKKKTTDSMIGFENEDTGDDTGKVNGKGIDQVNVPPESNEINHDDAHNVIENSELAEDEDDQQAPQPDLTESSKLDIVTDQYGLVAPPEELQPEEPEEDTGHDYNWFINEMRKEAKGFEENAETEQAEQPPADDDEPLQFERTSEHLHPSAPAPASASMPPATPPQQPQQPQPSQAQPQATAHHEAVDKFINEFRKEMEKFSDDDIPDVPVTNIAPDKKAASGENLPWHETLEEIDPAELGLFSKQVADLVAEKVARKIMARLEPDIIFNIIRETIEEYIREKIAK